MDIGKLIFPAGHSIRKISLFEVSLYMNEKIKIHADLFPFLMFDLRSKDLQLSQWPGRTSVKYYIQN